MDLDNTSVRKQNEKRRDLILHGQHGRLKGAKGPMPPLDFEI